MSDNFDLKAFLPNGLASSLREPKSHVDLMKHKTLTEKAFPHVRMRRLRQNAGIRDLVREKLNITP